jgi:hypothetical protein
LKQEFQESHLKALALRHEYMPTESESFASMT